MNYTKKNLHSKIKKKHIKIMKGLSKNRIDFKSKIEIK